MLDYVWGLSLGCCWCQVKQQTMAERQQGELRLEEAHQAEENAVAQMQQLRRECRQVSCLQSGLWHA